MLTSRSLAAIFGALYLVMGVVSLFMGGGDHEFLGVFPTNYLSAIVSILAGGILLYASQQLQIARKASIGVGAIVFALGALALAAPNLFGIMHFHGPSCYLNLAVGAILMLAALATPDEEHELDLEDHPRVHAH